MGITTDVEELTPFDATGELAKEYLVENDVALVKLRYLRKLAYDGGRLPRRQGLPRDALVAGQELKQHTLGKAGTRLFVVSHAWLSTEHPDPWGSRLEELLFQLNYLQADDTCLVFFDFCSLYQTDKTHQDYKRLKVGERLRPGHPAGLTPPQTKSVKAAMAGVDVLFASAACEVVVLPTIPHITDLAGIGWTRNRMEYIARGWCFTEFCIAKFFGRVVNTQLAKTRSLLGQDVAVTPHEFERRLKRGEMAFSAASDEAVVLPLYRRFHAASECKDLVKEIKAGFTYEHVEAIVSGLGALHWRVRRDLIQALGEKKVGHMAVNIAPALAERDYRVRIAAQDALARLRPVRELSEETRARLESDDAEAQVDTLKGLAKLGAMGYTQAGLAARELGNREVFVVRAAQDALLQMGLAAADAVAPLAADRDAQTRDAARQVLTSLGDVGFEAAAASLAARLRAHVSCGPGDAPRELLRALSAVGAAAAPHAESAVHLIGDRDPSVRCAAADALVKFGLLGAQAAAALLTHHDAEVRVQAIRVLKRMGPEGVMHADLVAKRLGDDLWTVRRHAVEFLGMCGDSVIKAHGDELWRLRDQDADEHVRLEAEKVLAGRPEFQGLAPVPETPRPASVHLLPSPLDTVADVEL